MSRYSYSRRAVQSCRAQRAARAAETGLSAANCAAQYQRPVLVHSGPSPMRMGEDWGIPYPWPWVRMDTAFGVPTRLDEATVWLTRIKGSLDCSLRLVGLYHEVPEGTGDPSGSPTIMPVQIQAELCAYTTGTTPIVLATATVKTDIICYPDRTEPTYPLITELTLGYLAGKGGYDRDRQTYSGGGLLRIGQLYEPDLALIQRVRISVDYGDAGWSPSFAALRENPCFVRITCIKNAAKTPAWDPAADQSLEHVRIFCVGSEMRDRGRI